MKNEAHISAHEHNQSWHQFITDNRLSEKQAALFYQYLILLQRWNKQVNITRIIATSDILLNHFHDALSITKYVDIASRSGICDVGSGGGFPGIPLAIMYPDVPIILLEVSQKKVAFLQEVINELSLYACQVCDLDWRTFLRKTDVNIDLFLARASLKPAELIRMFKPGCIYKNAELVYWASSTWTLGVKEKPFFVSKVAYDIGGKKRYLVFFKRHKKRGLGHAPSF